MISFPSDAASDENEFTLCFNDSIRCGLRAPVARPKSVSLTCPVPSTRKFCKGVGQSTRRQARTPHFGFKVTVNVSKFVKFVDGSKHLTDVKLGVFLFQNPRVVE